MEAVAEDLSFQHSPTTYRYSASNVVLLGLLLMALQALDGMLTVMGVSRFGVQVEGNPLLRYLMANFGTMPVVALKVAAICLIGFVCAAAYRARWIKPVLSGLCFVYIAFAVAPWSYILFIAPAFF